jgi:hypothetical protein
VGFGAAIGGENNIVAYTPVVLESAVAILRDCRKMNIDIMAIIASDEAIASLIVEPFYLASHNKDVLISTPKLQILFCRTILQSQKLAFYL